MLDRKANTSRQNGSATIAILITLVAAGTCADPLPAAEEPASVPEASALSQLAVAQFKLAVTARDTKRDMVEAGHYFLHAGLNAAAAGNEQLRVDASHAAQDVLGAMEFTIPHTSAADGVALSPKEDFLATWSFGARTVQIWSLKSGQHVRSLTLPSGVGHVRFHPHKREVLIGAHNHVAIWPFDQAEAVDQFDPLAGTRVGMVSRPVYHPDGESVLVRSASRVLWHWKPGSDPVEFDGPYVFGARFDRNRKQYEPPALIARSDGRDVRVWDFGDPAFSELRHVTCNGPVLQTIVNVPRREFLTWHGTPSSSTAQLWSLDPEQPEPLFGDDSWGAPGRVVISPDGSLAAAWELPPRNRRYGNRVTSLQVRVWSWGTRRTVATLDHSSPVHEAWFDPASQHLVTASGNGTVTVWGINDDGKIWRRIEWHTGHEVASIEFHPTRSQLLIVSGESPAQLFDIPSYSRMEGVSRNLSPIRQFSGSVKGAVFTSDGLRLVTWDKSRLVRVWNLNFANSPTLLRTRNGSGKPSPLRWLTKDRFVVGGYAPDPLAVWSTRGTKPLWQSPGYAPCPMHAASSDGEHLIVTIHARQPTVARRPDRPAPPDKENPPKPAKPPFELRSIHREEPLKVWPAVDAFLAGRRGFRFLDDKRYLTWLKHELTLEVIGEDEPVHKWNTSRWFYDVVPFANGQQLLATTNTDRNGQGEVVVLPVDGGEPSFRISAEADFLRAQLLPDESGVLVWHGRRRTAERRQSFARVHYFDSTRPTVTINNFAPRELESLEFDRECRFIAGSRFESREAWLWSSKSGKLLHSFHRSPPGETGFNENDIMHVKIDPHARYAVTWGGPARSSGPVSGVNMKLWSLTDFRPYAEYSGRSGNVVAVRDDGTFIRHAGNEVWLMSSSGDPTPLRRLKHPEAAIAQCAVHPESGDVYAQNMRYELLRWRLPTWNTDDLKRELRQLERRTAQVLDSSTGRLRINSQP